MKTIFVIQDVKTKEYYWSYRGDDAFDANISDAATFDSEEEALKQMQEEYLIKVFADRFLEIKKYYTLAAK